MKKEDDLSLGEGGSREERVSVRQRSRGGKVRALFLIDSSEREITEKLPTFEATDLSIMPAVLYGMVK